VQGEITPPIAAGVLDFRMYDMHVRERLEGVGVS
jgi:hypothetical protein